MSILGQQESKARLGYIRMERSLRMMVDKHLFQRQDDVVKSGRKEYLKELGDLLHHQHPDKDADNTFDNEEMREYVTINGFSPSSRTFWNFLVFCSVLEGEKQFMVAAKVNDVECMKMVGRGLNINAKNMVSAASRKHKIYMIV